MRKQFPACQKMEQQKLEATTASKALLVIINTKSFQKQQQPQFPTEKKKNGEAGASSSTKITTNFGLSSSPLLIRINTILPVRFGSPLSPDWSSRRAFKMAPCFPLIRLVDLNLRLVTSRGRARECAPPPLYPPPVFWSYESYGIYTNTIVLY